ncbi:MAG: hypothetical protein D3912_03785, partial [Candidatus Electrothrix sp. AX1]|nr:hypothetical protein [Candidatus Electrothrix sp. AX1]
MNLLLFSRLPQISKRLKSFPTIQYNILLINNTITMQIQPVILAGGTGTRLWPLSR